MAMLVRLHASEDLLCNPNRFFARIVTSSSSQTSERCGTLSTFSFQQRRSTCSQQIRSIFAMRKSTSTTFFIDSIPPTTKPPISTVADSRSWLAAGLFSSRRPRPNCDRLLLRRKLHIFIQVINYTK